MKRTQIPNFETVVKGGFKPELSRLRFRHSTAVLLRSTRLHCYCRIMYNVNEQKSNYSAFKFGSLQPSPYLDHYGITLVKSNLQFALYMHDRNNKLNMSFPYICKRKPWHKYTNNEWFPLCGNENANGKCLNTMPANSATVHNTMHTCSEDCIRHVLFDDEYLVFVIVTTHRRDPLVIERTQEHTVGRTP